MIQPQIAVALSCLVVTLGTSAARTQTGAAAPRVPPQVVKLFDADGDGRLSEQETARLREATARRRTGGEADAAPVPALPAETKSFRNIRYGAHPERNVLDIYVPGSAEEFYPLVIWIHGGGWKNGSKENARPALTLLERGYAVASINYRLSGDDIFPAQIEDCKAAIRYLRARAEDYHVDPRRFGVMGSSAGGHLAALVGTSGDVKELEGAIGDFDEASSRVQAVCDWFGPTDLLQMGGRHDDAASPESALIGGAIQEHKTEAARANPIRYVTPDDPPFLILHGTSDPVVPYSQSEMLAAALRKASVGVTLVPLEGAGHGGPEFMTDEQQRRIAEFFARHLRVPQVQK